jgi:hypothetical protein
MPKVTLEWDTSEDPEIIEALTKAQTNHRILAEVYQEVFRKEIKYGTDSERVKAFEMVWERFQEFLNDYE